MKAFSYKILFLFSLAFLLSFMPFATFAQSVEGGLVPCGNEKIAPGQPGEYGIVNPCKWEHILELVDKVVRFILFVLLVPIAAIMIAYAGFLMLFSGGNPDKRSKAKNILLNVVIGMFFAVGSWVIIHTLLDILGYEGAWIGF